MDNTWALELFWTAKIILSIPLHVCFIVCLVPLIIIINLIIWRKGKGASGWLSSIVVLSSEKTIVSSSNVFCLLPCLFAWLILFGAGRKVHYVGVTDWAPRELGHYWAPPILWCWCFQPEFSTLCVLKDWDIIGLLLSYVFNYPMMLMFSTIGLLLWC